MQHSYSHKRVITATVGLLLLATAIPFVNGPPSRAAVASATHQDDLNLFRSTDTSITEDTRQAWHTAYGNLPLSFEANRGQTDPAVRFISRTDGSTLFLTPTGAVLTLQTLHKQSGRPSNERSSRTSTTSVRMNLVGADPAVEIVGRDRLSGDIHYFKGNLPGQWQSNVPTFARVQYRNLYKGINLVYYGNQRQLEYDFEVTPGGDPKTIKMAFDGIRKLSVNREGDLVLHTAGTEIRMQKPTVYQEMGGVRHAIPGRYVLKGRRQVGFRVGHYDRTRTLVIDPVLSYSTFLGGNSDEEGRSIVIDAAGNAYVTGQTSSVNFPIVIGSFDTTYANAMDVFVTKLNANGSAVVYSTYLGGIRDDQGNHISVDSAGNAYVTGWTTSADFPVTPGVYQTVFRGNFNHSNAFITKLNSTGSTLLFSTYLGGTGAQGDIGGDEANGLDFDSQGNVFVVGATLSRDFPTTAGSFQPTAPLSVLSDGFVTKLNSAGTALIYSTYLGGLGDDQARAIKLTTSGEAIVTGSTLSTDFPTMPGAFQVKYAGPQQFGGLGDAFVSRLNATGAALVYSTYVGGSGDDGATSLALGLAEEVYLTGTTRSVDFPNTAGAISITNGGVARLTNGVSGWSNRGAGLTFNSILTLAINPVDPSILYAGAIGRVFKSTDGGGSWQRPSKSSPDTTFRCSAIDPSNPSILYFGGFGSGVHKTTDAGATWASINTGLPNLVVESLEVDPSNPQTVWVTNSDGVSKSTNGGSSWVLKRPGLQGALAIDPTHPATIYAGMSQPAVFKSTNGGDSWNITSLFATANVIAVDPSSSATVYVGTSGGLYKSTDAGSHWQPINAGLTERTIFDLAISPVNPAIIYAGTGQGVFRTTDAGATWNSTDPGLAGAFAFSLAINPLDPLIVYAGIEASSVDAFVTKLNSTGTALAYSTYLGGIHAEVCNAIAVDSAGNAYVTGRTASPNFPTTRGAFGASSASFGVSSAFVSKLNPNGTSLVYSTGIGGSGGGGNGIAVDASGSAYVAGAADSSDFPTTPGAFQTVLSGSSDAFITRIVPEPHLASDLSISVTVTPGGAPPITVDMPMHFEITVTNNGPDPAYSVVVHDDLPIALNFDACTSGSTAQCDGAGTGIVGSRNKLNSGESIVLVFVATVTCSIDNSQTISNTATVDSASFDSNSANNSATATFSVVNPTTTLSPTSQAFAASGGTGTVNVTRGSICSWEAQSNANWIVITSSAGCCDGSVTYDVAANNSSTDRTGTITIAGLTFTVTQNSTPTAIGLTSFEATAYDGGVYLSWKTGYEINNLGFRLYRDIVGERSAVNDQIIAGSALSVGSVALRSGREYGWWDKKSDMDGLQYWLEDIDLNGSSTWHGPFTVKQERGMPPARGTADLLSSLGASSPLVHIRRPLLERVSPKGEQQLIQRGLASALALKLLIREEGWYGVTAAELRSAGFAAADPRYLRLYAEGLEQAIAVSTSISGMAAKDDGAFAFEFFATGIDTPATDTRVYWLINGKQPGKRIQMHKSEATTGGARNFDYSVERRERSIYFAALRNGEVENFFGQVVATQPVEQVLALWHIDREAGRHAELEVALQGVTDLNTSPDHSVEVSLNGSVLGRIIFDGQHHHVEKFSVVSSLLREGENTVTFSATNGPGDISLIDYVRITYSHTFEADADRLRCLASSEQGPAQTISGFSSAKVRVIDVSNPPAVSELLGKVERAKDGSYGITVDALGPQRELLAFTDAQVKRPAAMILNQPSNLKQAQEGADLVIVTRREMMAALAPLVQLRQKQGLSVTVADVEDIYDEFNFGEKSSGALREFLVYAQRNWKKKPAYVLLAGNGSFDPKHYLGFGETDLISAKLIDTSYLETASDDWYVDFDDDGIGDIAIGRLPVRTAEEAAQLVSKLITYEQTGTSAEALLVADTNDDFNFELASAALVPLLPTGTRITQVNRGQLGDDQARKGLLEVLNRGPKLVNYVGHGSTDAWRGRLLSTDDASLLTNRNHLSVYVLMTCLNGYYDAGAVSLGEALMKAPGGAVAVWASTGMSLPKQQGRVNQEFFRQAAGGVSVKRTGLRLGELVQRAKAATSDTDVRRTWVLLGDPTLRLK